MHSKREEGECHTVRAVLRQLAQGKIVVDSWLFEFVSKHQSLLEEDIISRDEFARQAQLRGYTLRKPAEIAALPEPAPRKPRSVPETVLEPRPPKPPKPPTPPKPPPPPLTPDQVPPRIFKAAEEFAHDFGLSTEERDEVIRAVRREFPGEYPNDDQIRLTFFKHLA